MNYPGPSPLSLILTDSGILSMNIIPLEKRCSAHHTIKKTCLYEPCRNKPNYINGFSFEQDILPASFPCWINHVTLIIEFYCYLSPQACSISISDESDQDSAKWIDPNFMRCLSASISCWINHVTLVNSYN